MFGVHERSVRNWRDEIEALLGEHGFDPPGATRPIRTLEDLRAHLDAVPGEAAMVDGTHVPCSMPVDFDAQRAAYSGKDRDHVVKATVVADAQRRPLWFEGNPSGEGRTHDVTMLRAQVGLLAVLAATTATVLGDKAYVGLRHDLGPDRAFDAVGQAARRGPQRRRPRRQPSPVVAAHAGRTRHRAHEVVAGPALLAPPR